MTKPFLRVVGGKDMPVRKPKRLAVGAPRIAVETVGRQNLRAAVWPGRGTGRPLLVFNGLGMNLEMTAPLAAAMPDRDVVTFDMPGIGLSPAPTVPYRPWWAAHAAAKILDRYGYTDKIDVMGVSWGGLIAQQFAYQSAHRINRVALAATSPGATMVPGHLGVWARLLNPSSFVDSAALSDGFTRLLRDTENLPKGLASKFRAPTPAGYATQIFAMTAWTSLHILPLIRMPVLVMAGGRDRVAPPINSRILAALLPHGRLHLVKDAGHLMAVNRLDEIAPVLREFLDEDRLDRLRVHHGSKAR